MSAYDKFDKWADEFCDPTRGDVRPQIKKPEDLRFIPLFSDVLDNDPNNASAQAIRSMIADTSPSERAEALKNSGNKAYQLGEERWDDAIIYYTQAAEIEAEDDKLNSVIWANRGQVFLKKGWNKRCIQDCKKSLEFNPSFVKAYFRAAMAFLNLKNYEECYNFCIQGLEHGPENKQLKSILKKVTPKYKVAKEVKRRKAEKERLRLIEQELFEEEVSSIVEKRGLRHGNDVYGTLVYNYPRRMWREGDHLAFPVMFIYPEVAESDFIQCFIENQRFSEHFQAMFAERAPWDEDFKYKPKELNIYLANDKNKLIKINPMKKLSSILNRDDYIIPNIPVFQIIPKSSTVFLTNFKKNFEDGGFVNSTTVTN